MRCGLGWVIFLGCTTGALDVDVEPTPSDPIDTGNEEPAPPLAPIDERLMTHLLALQSIADENDGNRAVGTSGYDASTDYVWETLESFGLEPERHPFELTYYDARSVELGVPDLTLNSEEDYTVMWYSPGGEVTAVVHGVDLTLPPSNTPNSSTSGCDDVDYADFPTGAIALVQRGTCTYEKKARLANEHGASALIVFNEGQEGRRGLEGGTLDDQHDGRIPVLFATFALGEALSSVTEPIHINLDAGMVTLSQDNITATRRGTSDQRWMLGAHLDSVFQGPGINDNGTGVAVILEMARHIASIDPADSVTVSFWGAEEIGLVGSSAYAENLSTSEVEHIAGYLNLDMVGSPNAGRFIYAGDEAVADDVPGTEAIEAALASWFNDQEIPWETTAVNGRSDHAGFVERGIPSGGYFTGAEQWMSKAEAKQWGGTAEVSYDPCYHRECDTIDNVNMDVLVEMATATENTLTRLLNKDTTSSQKRSNAPMHIQAGGCNHEERESL